MQVKSNISPEAQAAYIEKCAKLKKQRKLKPRRIARTDSPVGSVNPAFRRL